MTVGKGKLGVEGELGVAEALGEAEVLIMVGALCVAEEFYVVETLKRKRAWYGKRKKIVKIFNIIYYLLINAL